MAIVDLFETPASARTRASGFIQPCHANAVAGKRGAVLKAPNNRARGQQNGRPEIPAKRRRPGRPERQDAVIGS